MHRIQLPRYREAPEGVMWRVEHQVLSLTSLELLQVSMRVTEIVAMLKHPGSRMEHFGVSFSDQHESSLDRFTVLVEKVIEHNRDLCSVSGGYERMPAVFYMDLIDDPYLTEEQSIQLQVRKNKLGV